MPDEARVDAIIFTLGGLAFGLAECAGNVRVLWKGNHDSRLYGRLARLEIEVRNVMLRSQTDFAMLMLAGQIAHLSFVIRGVLRLFLELRNFVPSRACC